MTSPQERTRGDVADMRTSHTNLILDKNDGPQNLGHSDSEREAPVFVGRHHSDVRSLRTTRRSYKRIWGFELVQDRRCRHEIRPKLRVPPLGMPMIGGTFDQIP